jgi:HD superfamily phosphohydrolase
MTRRLRDPVHGLIVFDDRDPLKVDLLAWALIDTPEFQRLRRIRQLGVSEFTFPGAVHTRFAHSIGVFHTARTLVKVIEREMVRGGLPFEPPKAKVALVAALLHDLGHGPFSHTFEEVQKSRGAKKRHEQWTAGIIRNPDGKIRPLLEDFEDGFTEKVAQLLEKEDPEDIYHAVVSSSFDADRLDYLRRDRMMTGIGAGAIDFDWLIDNVRVADIDLNAPDEREGDAPRAPTFCLEKKALPAAEQFLLARYTLHQQVYFHKATRCVEHMIGKLLRAIAHRAAKRGEWRLTGLPAEHALLRFFGRDGETVKNYLALDDAVITGSLGALARAEDPVISDTATRLRDRRFYKTLDLAEFGEDQGTQRSRLRRIRRQFENKIGSEEVLVDEKASIGIYGEIGGDEERMHKKLHILDAGAPKEISDLSPLINALVNKKLFTRVYFKDVADRDAARR